MILELIIVLIIILILIGASRLPEIGKGLGTTVGSFKRGLSENKKADVTKKKEASEEEKSRKSKE